MGKMYWGSGTAVGKNVAYRTLGLSDPRSIGPSVYRTLVLKDTQVYRAVTITRYLMCSLLLFLINQMDPFPQVHIESVSAYCLC